MKISHEIELMIACARVKVDLGGVEQIQQLANGIIDWEKFIKNCTRHKVLPLVFHNLVLICPDSFPEELKVQLEKGYIFENSLHNVALVDQLLFILELFKKHNIQAVPFKGPVLAESVFGDVTLRRYLDLDIFIAKSDAGNAVELLLDNGFIPENGILPTGKARVRYLDKLVAISLVQPDKHVSIDLQWDISNRFSNIPIILEDMEDRIEQVKLNNKPVPSVPAEELLCYLCIHGTKHRWLYLDLVCCVSELVRRRKDIDWHYTDKYAERIHCSNVLLLGLFLARELSGAELPDYINKKIDQTGKIEELAASVYEGLFSDYMESMITPEKFDPFLFQVKDNMVDKILYFLKLLFIPSQMDLRVFQVPEMFSFVRYFFRPIRLITEYCTRRIAIKIDTR